jgi:enoyl-CoA hydratase
VTPEASQRTGLRVERNGRVLTVVFDDPPRNYLTPPIVSALERIVRHLRNDRAIGAVILTGAGSEAFSTHFDPDAVAPASSRRAPVLSHRGATIALALTSALSLLRPVATVLEASPAVGLVHLNRLRRLHRGISDGPQVFLAAINGTVMGASLELALACDIRLAAHGSYSVGFPEARLGITLPTGGARRLAQITGPATAIRLLLEGAILDPAEAQRLGLFDRLLEPHALAPEAQALAHRLAQRQPECIRACRAAVHHAFSMRFSAALRLEQALFAVAASRPSAQRASRVYAQELAALGDSPLTRHALCSALQRVEGMSEGASNSFHRSRAK